MIELNNIENIHFNWLGLIEYQKALSFQLQNAEDLRQTQKTGIVFGLHHPTIVTLGKRADPFIDLEENSSLPTISIDRGGQATLHSPGQLVIYPILNLKKMNLEVRAYVQCLEATTIAFLKQLGVDGFTTAQPGVFTKRGKIAFIGVRVEKGITRHGISINISNDLTLFKNIRSCGVSNPTFDQLSNYASQVSVEEAFELWKVEFLRQLPA